MKTNRALLLLISISINTYCFSQKAESVKIGTQTWTTKNLEVITFRNGDAIPEVESDSLWNVYAHQSKPAWCYCKNDSAGGKLYGKLYNWFAVTDSRGLAPEGWHIPTQQECMLFMNKGVQNDANKLKNATGWKDDAGKDANGNNSAGFSGIPGGYRSYEGDYQRTGTYGFFWLATEYDDRSAWDFNLSGISSEISSRSSMANHAKGSGLSVRCIKD